VKTAIKIRSANSLNLPTDKKYLSKARHAHFEVFIYRESSSITVNFKFSENITDVIKKEIHGRVFRNYHGMFLRI
jgi:hypothetical protein